MQTMGDKTDSYGGARFSVALACVRPRHSRFEVEFSCGRHINAVLGDIGDILDAVKLNRQDLIVYIIKWNVKLFCPVLGLFRPASGTKKALEEKVEGNKQNSNSHQHCGAKHRRAWHSVE